MQYSSGFVNFVEDEISQAMRRLGAPLLDRQITAPIGLLQLARPLHNQLKQIRRRLPREIREHCEVRDSHLAFAGFDATDQVPMDAKGGSDIFLFEVGVVTGARHDSGYSPIPACTSLFRLLSQAVIPCASQCWSAL